MKKKPLHQGAIALALLVIVLLLSSCQYITGEAMTPVAEPEPTPETVSAPKSGLPFRINVSTAPSHLPGEQIMFGIGIINSSSGTITIDPFPPTIRIKSVEQDRVVYSSPAGTRTRDISSDSPFIPTKDTWDQKDDNREQVAPGWYEISYEYAIVEQSTGKKYTANPTARFQIVDPASAMTKDLDVNQYVTAEGITATLERIELNAVEVKVYILTTPPGYTVPQAGQLEEHSDFVRNSAAEYRVDGGVAKQPVDVGAQFNDSGARLIWHLDPIPSDAKELTFIITKLGDWEGPWEFHISLDSDGSASQEVTVSRLVSQPDKFLGMEVTLDAFLFYAIMESNALADSARLESSGTGKVVPVGQQIRVKGNLPQDLLNQLYTQESPSPLRTEFFGKLKITGEFEFDYIDSRYYVNITSAEVLDWAPPSTANGNLQINIQGSLAGELQAAKVVSIRQPEGQPGLNGITDANGTVAFNDIKQGRYEFNASLADHLPIEINVAVTGGRTTDVAYGMARVGEAPDDLMPAPGMGPQYRANMTAVRRDGSHVVNPWPPIQQSEVTLGTSPNAIQVSYRDYIETQAGQTRNNQIFIYRPGGNLPTDIPLDVALKATDLPSGITVTGEGQYRGSGSFRKINLRIEIPKDVQPEEYSFGIDVQINDEDYGTVPCTISVLP